MSKMVKKQTGSVFANSKQTKILVKVQAVSTQNRIVHISSDTTKCGYLRNYVPTNGFIRVTMRL